MKARVHITLKDGVLDPQGQAVQGALASMGFGGVTSARQGKVIDLELDAKDADTARAEVADMCEKLLANTVIETYDIEIG